MKACLDSGAAKETQGVKTHCWPGYTVLQLRQANAKSAVNYSLNFFLICCPPPMDGLSRLSGHRTTITSESPRQRRTAGSSPRFHFAGHTPSCSLSSSSFLQPAKHLFSLALYIFFPTFVCAELPWPSLSGRSSTRAPRFTIWRFVGKFSRKTASY